MLSSRDHTAGQIGMLGFCSVLHAIALAPLFVETGRERKRKGALMQRRSPGRFSRPALSGAWDLTCTVSSLPSPILVLSQSRLYCCGRVYGIELAARISGRCCRCRQRAKQGAMARQGFVRLSLRPPALRVYALVYTRHSSDIYNYHLYCSARRPCLFVQ
jgi:hypothetical protein